MWLVAFIMDLHLTLHAVHAGLGGLAVHGVASGRQWLDHQTLHRMSACLFVLPQKSASSYVGHQGFRMEKTRWSAN